MIEKRTLDRLYGAVMFIGFLNFIAFVLIAINIGGDAVNGHALDGHFYLANHGQLTEVSEPVFRYSYAHAVSVWITHPAMLIAMALQQWAPPK